MSTEAPDNVPSREEQATTPPNPDAGADGAGPTPLWPDYLHWRRELRQAGLELRPAEALTEYLRARRALRGASLTAAVDYYRRTHAQGPGLSVEELTRLYLEGLEHTRAGSARSVRGILGEFSRQFPGPLAELHMAEIQVWLDEVGGDLPRRSLQTLLATLQEMFAWARRRKYWNPNHPLPTDGLALGEDYPHSPHDLLAPSDFQTLLIAAHRQEHRGAGELLAWLVLAGFAGLRPGEIRDLRPAEAGVLASRVPVDDGLALWLAHLQTLGVGLPPPHLPARGREIVRLARRLEIMWPRNALRNSWICYRLALEGDESRIAAEAGVAVAVLHRHYSGRAQLAEAEAWFGIRPEWCHVPG